MKRLIALLAVAAIATPAHSMSHKLKMQKRISSFLKIFKNKKKANKPSNETAKEIRDIKISTPQKCAHQKEIDEKKFMEEQKALTLLRKQAESPLSTQDLSEEAEIAIARCTLDEINRHVAFALDFGHVWDYLLDGSLQDEKNLDEYIKNPIIAAIVLDVLHRAEEKISKIPNDGKHKQLEQSLKRIKQKIEPCKLNVEIYAHMSKRKHKLDS